MISIDTIFNLSSPILRYPILLILPFTFNPWILSIGFILTLLINALILFNNWSKCHGKWSSLDEFNQSGQKKYYILITGGSNGLGLEIIQYIFETFKNIEIINLDIEKNISLEEDKRIHFYQVDLSDLENLSNTINKIKKNFFHNNDSPIMIINNAGIRSKYLNMLKMENFNNQRLFNTNFFAPFAIIHQFLSFKERPIKNSNKQCFIVNISSSTGILGPSKVSTYAASKAAIIAAHTSLESELALSDHIRTLLVIAGQLDTRMFAGFEPPRQFLAPVVKSKDLAKNIIDYANIGKRGTLCAPFYSNFAYLLMSMPYCIQQLARKISKMDECLPNE